MGGLLEDGGDELKGIDTILYAYTFLCLPEETRSPVWVAGVPDTDRFSLNSPEARL
jgi:hypothetical protein